MKDYYAVLGVARNESSTGIRARYRDIVAQAHSFGFEEAAKAHSVLSDTSRKHAYDERLSRFTTTVESAAIPVERTPARENKGKSVLADAHGVHPSFEALYERILRNFTGRGIPKAEHAEALTVNVLVDAEDAAAGCVISIGIPVYDGCPFCRGTTTESLFRCLYCRGERMLEKVQTVAINFPAQTARATMVEAPLGDLGIQNLFLRLYVAVSR
jgi:DnaJ-class molecular chaperone